MDTFDIRVSNAVMKIPYGKVATYGQIADLIGRYGSARQVGWVLRDYLRLLWFLGIELLMLRDASLSACLARGLTGCNMTY